MSKRGNGYGGENRVNILKKAKARANRNLDPAVVGSLRNKDMMARVDSGMPVIAETLSSLT
jgi:hypothetical protein